MGRSGDRWLHPDTGKPIRKYTYANTREEAAHWIALTLVSETSKAAPSLASELLLKDFLAPLAHHVQNL